EALRGITRHGPPAPQLLTVVDGVRRHVTALMELGACFADKDAAIGNARRTRDRQHEARIGDLLLPDLLAALRIDGDQAPVERSPDDLVFPHCDTAIDDAAAELHGE